VTAFFEIPSTAPPVTDLDWLPPVWRAPPLNVVGSRVAVDFVLARTHEVAVFVSSVLAYPTGIAISLGVRRRSFSPDPSSNMSVGSRDAPADGLHFGLQFSDGSKVTTLDSGPTVDGNDPRAFPARPVLTHNGGGGVHSFDHDFWVWPLPPAGPVAFVCEWLARGIPLTRIEVDGSPILEAADRAEVLWDPPEPSGSGGWAAYGPFP
jgi:hypothetical protein